MKLIYLPTHLPLKTHQPSMDIVKYTVNSSHGFPVMGYPPTFDFDADALGVLSDTPAAGNVPEILGVPYDQGLYSLYTCGYKSALS